MILTDAGPPIMVIPDLIILVILGSSIQSFKFNIFFQKIAVCFILTGKTMQSCCTNCRYVLIATRVPHGKVDEVFSILMP